MVVLDSWRRMSCVRRMTVVLVFEGDVMRLNWGYAPKSGDCKKNSPFYDDWK